MANLKILSAICYFCKGYKYTKGGEIVKTKGGGRAFKCGDCLELDKQNGKNRKT